MYIKEIYTLIHTPNDEIKKKKREIFSPVSYVHVEAPCFFNAELSLVHTSAINFYRSEMTSHS